MTTKLTLSIDENTVKKAKEYSKKNGRSLSKLIENYLLSLTIEKKENNEATNVPSFLKKWHGAFKSNDQQDYKEVISEEISKKLNHI